MSKERINKIAELINTIFILTTAKENKAVALVYAEEIHELNIKIIPKELKRYILANKPKFGPPTLDLFLAGLGVTAKKDNALVAWESVQDILPYMKDSTNYRSPDKVLISTLAQIGVKTIMQMQESVGMYTNKINSYQLPKLKERFIGTYKQFEKSGEVLLLENGKGNVRNIYSTIKREEKPLLENKSKPNLIDFNNNVKSITQSILSR